MTDNSHVLLALMFSHDGLRNPGNRGLLAELLGEAEEIMPGTELQKMVVEPGEIDGTTPENKGDRVAILKSYLNWAVSYETKNSKLCDTLCMLGLHIGAKHGLMG